MVTTGGVGSEGTKEMRVAGEPRVLSSAILETEVKHGENSSFLVRGKCLHIH